ncbi:uncharacterized protein LOC109857982 [Pseudomyrmex gracilis]|uniref:uncharacterized protein LOC109857982 n=1 Tax=Pseudomyrmex gracilis TaxID=219809 RepID=UPI000995B4F2|nr:uncharacterized protein LOC109857982 [Pseudomyrmex gracilis]
MFRSIFVSFAILIVSLFQTTFAIPVSDSKTFVLTDEHIVPKSEVQNLEINSHQNDWIGNIEVGAPQNDLIYFYGTPYTIQNDLTGVATLKLTYTFTNKDRTFHYVKVVSDNNYAVICADSDDLGSISFTFTVRVTALSSSKVIPLFGVRYI